MKSKTKLCALFVVLVSAGCAVQPKYKLVKSVSEDQLRQDNAACQNQAQMIQMSDWEFKGTFMEGANIQMKRNRAFENCLISKGYIRQGEDAQQAHSEYLERLKFNDSATVALCDKPEFKPLFDHTNCGKQDISIAMLNDNTRITKSQKLLFQKYDAEQAEISSERSEIIKSSSDAKMKEYYMYYEANIEMPQKINKSELYSGKKTWGEYNKEKLKLKSLNLNKFNEIKNR